MRLFLLLFLAASPALADPVAPMTAEAFQAYVEGKTLTYGVSGADPYGAEHYGPERAVTWSFLDGRCERGSWYPEGQHICFRYEAEPDPQCWDFYVGAEGLRAVFVGAGGGVLYEVKAGQPLSCPAPDLTS